jgi:hypothetical protein
LVLVVVEVRTCSVPLHSSSAVLEEGVFENSAGELLDILIEE